MATKTLNAAWVGEAAGQVLADAATAVVIGVTSRGVFLGLSAREVVFLSYEAFRGPRTVNLGCTPANPGLRQGQAIDIKCGEIVFPGLETTVRFEGAPVWAGVPVPPILTTAKERSARIAAVGRHILAQKGEVGLTGILAALLQIRGAAKLARTSLCGRVDLGQLTLALHSSDDFLVINHLERLLGLGPGLTPSGDDLLVGLFLTCSRYPQIIDMPWNLPSVGSALAALALRKTSLLSANLVASATRGQADERLILALDGMLTGALDPAACANHLLGWGNSSGCDALVGMALAAYPPQPGN